MVFSNISLAAAPAWLMVMTSNSGRIDKSAESYKLSIDSGDVKNLLSFSERPMRIVNKLTIGDFVKFWAKDGGFSASPPNAAIVIDGDIQVAILKTLSMTKSILTFELGAEKNTKLHEAKGSDIQIFIDSGNYKTPGVY